MTKEEFNDVWKDRIEPGFYGCQIYDETIINYLNSRFKEYAIEYPDFTFSQIKNKFGRLVVYIEGVPERYTDRLLNGMKL